MTPKPSPQRRPTRAQRTVRSRSNRSQTPAEVLAALEGVRALDGVTQAEVSGPSLEVLAHDAAAVLGGVVEAVTRAGAHVRAVEVVEPNLESVFLHLTGRGLRD